MAIRGLLHQFTQRVGLRLFLIAICISLVAVLPASYLLLAFQRQQLVDSAKDSAIRQGELIEAGLEHAMLINDWEFIASIINPQVETGVFNAIRVVDKHGQVMASSDPAELDRIMDPGAEECRSCHAQPGNASAILDGGEGESRLWTVHPIHNRPECYRCHDAQEQVLGVLITEKPLDLLDRQISAAGWGMVFSGSFTFLLLASLLLLAGYNMHLLAETRERQAETQDLYRLVREVSGSLHLDKVLQSLAAGVRRFLATDLCIVVQYDEEQNELVFSAVDDRVGDDASVQEQLYPAVGQPVELLGLRLPAAPAADCGCTSVCKQELLTELRPGHILYPARPALEAAGVVSLIVLPLRLKGQTMGMILAASRQMRVFTRSEIQKMERLGPPVLAALKNARLYQQASYQATLDERERLAGEMHDQLAQALCYLNLKAAMVDGLLQENQVAQARAALKEMKQVSQLTYTDVREAIFNLRAAMAYGLRFLPSLEEYVQEYRQQYGMDVSLEVNGVDLAGFSPDADVQLLRVIQEALTNVRKHANALHSWIRFYAEDGRVRVEIEDDGCGFNPSLSNDKAFHSFGLKIMRERVESVGGTLQIDSQPGNGARLMIWIPVERPVVEPYGLREGMVL